MKNDPSARRNPLSEYLGGTSYSRFLLAIDGGNLRRAALWAVAVGLDDGNSIRWAWRGRQSMVWEAASASPPARMQGLA